jgi:FKBP-type peptidyl-prolyl cis-trans isomerase 2
MKEIKAGSKVKVEYTGRFEDGTVFDASREPLSFTVGEKKVIPGFEKQITGMKKGEKKTIKLKPEEAYGEVNEKFFVEIPKSFLAGRGVEPKQGMRVRMEPKDQEYPARVARIKEVKEDKVVLDLNHPLAGKTLIFDVTIVDIE